MKLEFETSGGLSLFLGGFFYKEIREEEKVNGSDLKTWHATLNFGM